MSKSGQHIVPGLQGRFSPLHVDRIPEMLGTLFGGRVGCPSGSRAETKERIRNPRMIGRSMPPLTMIWLWWSDAVRRGSDAFDEQISRLSFVAAQSAPVVLQAARGLHKLQHVRIPCSTDCPSVANWPSIPARATRPLSGLLVLSLGCKTTAHHFLRHPYPRNVAVCSCSRKLCFLFVVTVFSF